MITLLCTAARRVHLTDATATLDGMLEGAARRISLALSLLAVVVLLPVLPFPSTAPPLPSYFSGAVKQLPEGGVALIAPYARASHGEAMLWQAISELVCRSRLRPGPRVPLLSTFVVS